uniref:Uncharacterized protein n=1 Tax=Anguilla anguilla TaxID=7936 RepID=A0A0E9QAN2_ANGAN
MVSAFLCVAGRKGAGRGWPSGQRCFSSVFLECWKCWCFH